MLDIIKPLAITMWDFSWLERRWPGAGYEDWDKVLDELKERGYDAVRIDPYPHLFADDPHKEWELIPVWNQNDWGSPALTRVEIKENLKEFLTKCSERNIKVGLSTWFRQDVDDTRMKIKTPLDLAKIWSRTLEYIKEIGLADIILYVDLCNEFPLKVWTPFMRQPEDVTEIDRKSPEGVRWMKDSIDFLKNHHPEFPYCFSFTSQYDTWKQEDVSYMDLLELHIWMAQQSDFYEKVNYNYEAFSPVGYQNVVAKAEKVYRENEEYLKSCLKQAIDLATEWSVYSKKHLITTECWAIVDYKDWPLLSWDWVKELCEYGVKEAAATGRWSAISTSNFCGPQFVGMWRDVEWHKKMTDIIHNARVED